MEKKSTKTDLLLNGRQAFEVFSLKPEYRSWMEKGGYLKFEKTKTDWEKFFKENKVI